MKRLPRLALATLLTFALAASAHAKGVSSALDYVPDNARTVIGVNVSTIQGTAFYKFVRSEMLDMYGIAGDVKHS